MFLTVSFHTTRGNFFFFFEKAKITNQRIMISQWPSARCFCLGKNKICRVYNVAAILPNFKVKILMKHFKNLLNVMHAIYKKSKIAFSICSTWFYIINSWVFVYIITYDKFWIILLEFLSSTNFEIGRSAAVSDVCLLG